MKKLNLAFFIFATSSVTFYACKKNSVADEMASASKNFAASSNLLQDNSAGAVYVLSNAADGNKVLVFQRSSDGHLTSSDNYATGGNGTGAGLGSQGSVILHQFGGTDFIFAVNAGSNDVTVFKAEGTKLTWIDKVSSHGTLPISITAHDNLLYVLNAGGTGNISGFRISSDGHLNYLPNSSKALSTDNSGPAEVRFNNQGTQIAVTEKNTNSISTYTVYESGLTSVAAVHASVGTTPFGFAFDNQDHLLVTDAFGGAAGQSAVTSYNLNNTGNLSLIDGPEPTHQTSACWLAVTNNGKYCYATNTGSGTISGYHVENGGSVTLLNSNGITATTGVTPGDVTLSINSRFLYNLNSTSHSITLFSVNEDGSLDALGTVDGVPAGAVGIAAK